MAETFGKITLVKIVRSHTVGCEFVDQGTHNPGTVIDT